MRWKRIREEKEVFEELKGKSGQREEAVKQASLETKQERVNKLINIKERVEKEGKKSEIGFLSWGSMWKK